MVKKIHPAPIQDYLEKFQKRTFVVKMSPEGIADEEVIRKVIADVAFLTKNDVNCVIVRGIREGVEVNGMEEVIEGHDLTPLKIEEKLPPTSRLLNPYVEMDFEPQRTQIAGELAERKVGIYTVRLKDENDDADFQLATAVASILKATKLLLLTASKGLYLRNGDKKKKLLSFVDVDRILSVLQARDEDGPLVSPEMQKNLFAAVAAINDGIEQVHLISHFDILNEVLTRTGAGTLIEKGKSHFLEIAKEEDLDGIYNLHHECSRPEFSTPNGTTFLKPKPKKALKELLPSTLVLKHRGMVIGKLYWSRIKEQPNTALIGGFAVGENHQGDQQGKYLFAEALHRLAEAGFEEAVSITASPLVQRLYLKLGGSAGAKENWKKKMLENSRKRFALDADLVEIFSFHLRPELPQK